MKEVSTDTAALLLDAVSHRGGDAAALWAGLPLDLPSLTTPGRRIDWEVWVEMMARVAERYPGEVERLFVSGAGARTRHPFVRIANTFLSVPDIYALFARWGLRRNLMVLTATFTSRSAIAARFTVDIPPTRVGSLPTLQFIAGVLRHLPGLQGLPDAEVTIAPGPTPHHATYLLELPRDGGRLARARRVLRTVTGAAAALDELEQQATEIAAKNQALTQQLAETAQAAAEARVREAWMALALEAGQVGTWRFQLDTRTVSVSQTMGRLFGLPSDTEHPVERFSARILAEDRPRISTAIERAIADGEPFATEYRIVRPSGELAWLAVNGRLVRETPGNVAQVLGTAVDVTAQRLLDTRLRSADRLIAAGTLAAGVAHEINNPLTYVLGNIDLLRMRQRDLTPDVSLALTQIRDGIERIRDVVADLRAFARPDERLVGRVELRAVCEAALRITASLVRHRATIATDFAADTPTVLANESRLGQVVINLIVNASHAMPARPTAANLIVVRTSRLPDGAAAIEVEDNGSGIPPEVLPRLFDPFFTTKAPGEGTGLGLSVCHSIVAALDGRIEVTTVVDGGTTFRVVLPAAPPVEPAAAPPPPAAAPTPRRRQVLVIDDEPVVRRVVTAMLTAAGCDVVQADGGRGGLALATGERTFDAIVCDLMMPDVDGVAIHAAVARSHPERLDRMLFVTGGAVTPHTAAFLARADLQVLAKPFGVAELIAAIDRVTRPG
ncbi:MAG: response regulator [Myxococcales bacterium]|nr:response regulator [Myxococcales bacterium]